MIIGFVNYFIPNFNSYYTYAFIFAFPLVWYSIGLINKKKLQKTSFTLFF